MFCVSMGFIVGVLIFLTPPFLLFLYIMLEQTWYLQQTNFFQIRFVLGKYNRSLIDKARQSINKVSIASLQQNLPDIYNDIDKRIEQEDGLLNQRTNFFLLAETFLIIPYFQILSTW